MATYWARANSVLYHGNGAVFVNFMGARKNLTATKGVLQANTAFIVSRIWSALVFTLQAFVQANVAYVAMKRLIAVDSTDATLFTVEWILVNRREVFAGGTEIVRHFRITATAFLASFVNQLLVVTDSASDMCGINGSRLVITACL